MKYVLLFVVLTACCSECYAQSAQFIGESLVVIDGKRRIRLSNIIDPEPEYRVVHAVKKRGGEYFIVIGVSELSHGYPPRGGYCGCGIESHIDWLRVHDGKVLERQSGLYASCFKNRDGYMIEWKQGILQWRTEGQRVVEDNSRITIFRVDYSWSFDPSHPERGINEHSEDKPDDKPMMFDKPQSVSSQHQP